MNLKGWLIISLCLILVFLVGALGTAGCNPSKTDVLPQENETEGGSCGSRHATHISYGQSGWYGKRLLKVLPRRSAAIPRVKVEVITEA